MNKGSNPVCRFSAAIVLLLVFCTEDLFSESGPTPLSTPPVPVAKMPGLSAGQGSRKIDLEWYYTNFGSGIGDTGLEIADLDGDGKMDIISGASILGFEDNTVWYVMEYDAGFYVHQWISLPYEMPIERIAVGQMDSDAALEVLVAVDGKLLMYDGITFQVELEISIPTFLVQDMTTANLDEDPAIEAVICDITDTYVYDLATATSQLVVSNTGCGSIEVGETDGTPGLEIVVAAGSSNGWVLDAITGAVDSHYSSPGFGVHMAVADIDGDGLDEIVGLLGHEILAWNDDTGLIAWEVADSDLAAVTIGDIDGDDDLEVIYGHRQHGDLRVLNGADGSEQWVMDNPSHGMTNIAVGDVDGDEVTEIIYGSGYSSTGPDFLYVVDSTTESIEWQNEDINGPYYGLDYGDVDADGEIELVFTSAYSNGHLRDGSYYVHDANTKALEFMNPDATDTNVHGIWGIELANIDLDPALEIFFPSGEFHPSNRGVMFCYDGVTHAIEWQQALPEGLTFKSLEIADVDSDENLELVTGLRASFHDGPAFVFVFDAATGDIEWQSPDLSNYFDGRADLSFLSIGDVDDDSIEEIIVGQPDDSLVILDPITQTVERSIPDLGTTSLTTFDIDADTVPEIIIGNELGEILHINESNGDATLLAGPFGGAIQGLTLTQITGDDEFDYIFALEDRLYVIDGKTHETTWTSDYLGFVVGELDSIEVGDIDADGLVEIWINTGHMGHMILEVSNEKFLDLGFESNASK